MKYLLPLTFASLLFSGCVTTETGEPNRQANGAIIGAIAGAVLGAQIDDDDGNKRDGVLIGAVAGAAAGGAIGARMDRQQAEFEEQLAAERRANEIEIERVREDLLKVTFNNEVTFDVNSAAVKESFKDSLDKVADVLKNYGSRATIVGHTDSTGTESYNQDLSERRAAAVRNYLIGRGIPSSQIASSGRGELEPSESNDTEDGRQLNRRVEVFVQPGN